MPKIAVYTMAEDEAEHVPRFVQTTRGADVVVVTDTGSTDGTADLLRDAGVAVHEARILPWRFDVASNVALAHVPENVDVCIKLDLDEVLFTNDGAPWRTEIERLGQPGVNRLRYWYTWSWELPGEVPAVRFRTENIHARSGFVWRHPGHAALCGNEPGKQTAVSETLEIHHYMTTKSRPNYLPLLELAVQENRCPQTIFYLGREFFFRRLNQQAIERLEEYLAHPQATWKAERADALRMIGVSWQRAGNPPRVLANLMRAIAEYPGVRELWFELLRWFYETGDWLGGYWAGSQCLAINVRDEQFIGHNGDAWSDPPLVLTAQFALRCGRKDEGVALARQAIALNPHGELAQRAGEVL